MEFLIVHIFSERARMYYDLERLWRNAERIEVNSPEGHDAGRGATTICVGLAAWFPLRTGRRRRSLASTKT